MARVVVPRFDGGASLRAQEYIRDSEPRLFSHDQLVQLGPPQPLSPETAERLHTLLTAPFINNEAYDRGAKPWPLDVTGLGPSLRLWNIARGLERDDVPLFLTDRDRFMAEAEKERKKAKESGKRIRDVGLEKNTTANRNPKISGWVDSE